MGFGRPLEKPSVVIVGPPLRVGPTILTKGFSEGRQIPILHESNRVIAIITTLQGTSSLLTVLMIKLAEARNI